MRHKNTLQIIYLKCMNNEYSVRSVSSVPAILLIALLIVRLFNLNEFNAEYAKWLELIWKCEKNNKWKIEEWKMIASICNAMKNVANNGLLFHFLFVFCCQIISRNEMNYQNKMTLNGCALCIVVMQCVIITITKIKQASNSQTCICDK